MKVKPKKCKNCQKKFTPKYSTLEQACSIKCAAELGKKKEKAKRKKAWQKEKKELEKNLTNWKNKLQSQVQRISRYIDFGLLCLARNQKGQIQGGHVFSKKVAPNIRFNLHNIHRQCAQSNKWEQDDVRMRESLAIEYGQEYLDDLIELKNQQPQVHYTNEQYHAFYLKARKIANRLEKENKTLVEPRSMEERKRLRSEINEELGIYNQRNY